MNVILSYFLINVCPEFLIAEVFIVAIQDYFRFLSLKVHTALKSAYFKLNHLMKMREAVL